MNGIKHVADPDPFPSGLGSGSGSGPVGYSKEHNKMLQSNFWLVPIGSSDMETQVKIFEKKLFWYIRYHFETERIWILTKQSDTYQSENPGSGSKWIRNTDVKIHKL
jgi:hypothetical protein